MLSATGSFGISVSPEKNEAKAGEIIYIPISVTGENGIVESNADRELIVGVTGGELLGFGSANPRTTECFDEGRYTTYYGHSLAIVRAGEGKSVTVRATDGDRSCEVQIPVVGSVIS